MSMAAAPFHRCRGLLVVEHPTKGNFVVEFNLDRLFSGEPDQEFPPILNLPDPVAKFNSVQPTENMAITDSGNLIVAATSLSRTLLYDASSRSASTGPDMLSGKIDILLVPVADGTFFAMSFYPHLDDTPHAELLASNTDDAGGRLAWHPIPDPPLSSIPRFKRQWHISGYFVAGTRVWISFLDEGTFSFDTACRRWRREGTWKLPVTGRALLIPDFLGSGQQLLFGFFSRDHHFCTCDIEARPPVIIKSWPEAIPSRLVWCARYFIEAHTAALAYYGAGRFCISTVITTGYSPQKPINMDEVLNLPRRAVSIVAVEVTPGMQLIKRKLECYSMPAEAHVGEVI
ncbi:unnamed protein product [Triticum turgidum subsp. durum]|uniref:Uncharacterized protein n=1 Tax=Triticum turgidum subsp. durum TaxID=4567 RepID=A0A9R1A7X9_TRITD|nr:unnamed protein product [Triticum turgidum subsp. durum]